METAVFGGGCFWCIEALLKCLKGVVKVTPGYCGGKDPFPNYTEVKTGTTGHIQVVLIDFDPQIITFQQLFNVFMNAHDPTQEDGQGEDIGSQYISSVFCKDFEQYTIATNMISKLEEEQKKIGKHIYTKIFRNMPFYEAEELHQNYYELRGKQNPYCNIIPGKIAKLRKLFVQSVI